MSDMHCAGKKNARTRAPRFFLTRRLLQSERARPVRSYITLPFVAVPNLTYERASDERRLAKERRETKGRRRQRRRRWRAGGGRAWGRKRSGATRTETKATQGDTQYGDASGSLTAHNALSRVNFCATLLGLYSRSPHLVSPCLVSSLLISSRSRHLSRISRLFSYLIYPRGEKRTSPCFTR